MATVTNGKFTLYHVSREALPRWERRGYHVIDAPRPDPLDLSGLVDLGEWRNTIPWRFDGDDDYQPASRCPRCESYDICPDASLDSCPCDVTCGACKYRAVCPGALSPHARACQAILDEEEGRPLEALSFYRVGPTYHEQDADYWGLA